MILSVLSCNLLVFESPIEVPIKVPDSKLLGKVTVGLGNRSARSDFGFCARLNLVPDQFGAYRFLSLINV